MKTIRVRMYRRNPSATRKRRKRKHTRFGKVRAHKRRVNPFKVRATRKRRRRNPVASRRKRTRRRNPALSLRGALNKNTILRALGLGAGFLGGTQVLSLVTTGTVMGRPVFTPPAFLASVRPGLGLVPVIVGGILAVKAKKAVVKDVAFGIVAAGGVDVIRQVLTIASPATAASVGLYVNEGMAPIARRPENLGAIVTRTNVGRIGPEYRIPNTRNLRVAGYKDASFADVESSFA